MLNVVKLRYAIFQTYSFRPRFEILPVLANGGDTGGGRLDGIDEVSNFRDNLMRRALLGFFQLKLKLLLRRHQHRKYRFKGGLR